ncbi:MAG TPA: hypothetical protein VM056_04970, partial [Terriglobales bacterium]|nr:hypothetical protein [Terriglobales bacterium]
MAKKVIVGGLVAGLLIFIWSSIAHVALPIGEMGIKTSANEEAVIAALKPALNEHGMYIVPGHEAMAAMKSGDKAQQEASMKTYDSKYKGGPWALIVYHPTGASMAPEPRMLVMELLADIVAGMILAWALSLAAVNRPSFGGRVVFIVALTLLPLLITDFSQWNWFGFPS